MVRASQEAHRSDTGRAQAERLAGVPNIGAHFEARKKAAMSDPGMIARLQAIGVKIGQVSKPTPTPKTISLRRKGGKTPAAP